MCGAWKPLAHPGPAQAQTPNGKGAEVAGRGCGGFWQEKTLQKKWGGGGCNRSKSYSCRPPSETES